MKQIVPRCLFRPTRPAQRYSRDRLGSCPCVLLVHSQCASSLQGGRGGVPDNVKAIVAWIRQSAVNVAKAAGAQATP